MDRLATCQLERILPYWIGQAYPDETFDQKLLQSALGWSILVDHSVEPLFENCDAVLAAASVPLEVVSCGLRGDELEVPRIFSGSSKPKRMEYCSKAKQHP